MESTTEIEWFGDAKERLIERAKAREDWGDYQGISNLGKRLIQEVTEKISEIFKNLNLYSERNDEERVAPLESGFVLIYKKIYYTDSLEIRKVKLVLLDVRKNY
jgi:hypothetical protein